MTVFLRSVEPFLPFYVTSVSDECLRELLSKNYWLARRSNTLGCEANSRQYSSIISVIAREWFAYQQEDHIQSASAL